MPDRDDASADVMRRHRDRLLSKIAAGARVEPQQPTVPEIPGHRVLRVIGRGASGVVVEAHRIGDARPLAIKVVRADRGGLRRELRASQRIDHPGLVRIHDAGETDAHEIYLVMDLLPGEDLGALMDREGALPWTRVRPLLLQLCDAMASAHDHGVIHRDLKPANIMVWRESAGDGAERCAVIDLGLSRVIGDSITSSGDGAFVGTPAYMSPEQIRGGDVDGRADVYALGCIAYEMLMGHRPFPGETPGELAVQHLTRSPVPPSLRGPRRDRRALEAVLARALAKDPAQRFADMRSFAAALESVGLGDIRSEPGARGSWSRRRMAVLGTTMIATGGLLGLALHGYATSSRARRPTTRPDAPAAGGSRSSSAPTPSRPASSPRIVDVTTSLGHTCAVADDGRMQCWGMDAFGRLGRGVDAGSLGDDEWPSRRPPLPLTDIVRVVSAANARHSCAIDRDAALRCWGDGSFGGLGLGTTLDFGDDATETLDRLHPLPLPPVLDVATSTSRTCAIVDQDEHRRLYCWGRGAYGALGQGSTEAIGDDEDLRVLAPVALGADVRRVTMGNDHTCALLSTGAVRCWGSDALGQLGIPNWTMNVGDGVGDGLGRGRIPDDPALDVYGLRDVEVVDVRAGGNRTCVLTAEGGVRCWGSNRGSALGHRWSELAYCSIEDEPRACMLDAPLPFDIDFGSLDGARVTMLAVGQRHACILDSVGRVRCWGEGREGQLGIPGSGDVGHHHSPAEVWAVRMDRGVVDLGDADGDGAPDRAVAVAAGYAHSCALMEGGTLRCWGTGDGGRLGYASVHEIGVDASPGDVYAITGLYDVPVFSSPGERLR